MESSPRPGGHEDAWYCNAPTRQRGGAPCDLRAGEGTGHLGVGHCWHHLGRTEAHEKSAAKEIDRRRVERVIGDAGALIAEHFADLAEVNDLEALAESCRRAGAMERMWAELVASLDLAYGGEDGIVGPDHSGDGAPHVYVAQLALWQRQHAQLRKWALDVGIDQRRLDVAEADGRRIVAMLLAGFDALFALLEGDVAGERLAELRREQLPDIVRRAIETTSTEAA